MNIAICAATPFQTLNAINLSMHSLDKATKKILFIEIILRQLIEYWKIYYGMIYLMKFMNTI